MLKNIRQLMIVLLLTIVQVSSFAQSFVTISGQAYDKETKLPLPKLMVINMHTNNGVFADAEGKFSIIAKQSDTIMLSAVGFKLKKIYLKDSTLNKQYFINVPLEKLFFQLKEISVFAPRTLKEIDKDISTLDSSKAYAPYQNINAVESPITYLYERFSKFGKSKQKVIEWENEDLKRAILKDLFRLYVKYDIIDLSEEEFEAFIKYCNLSEYFIKNASQLELVMAVKGKYESFKYRWK